MSQSQYIAKVTEIIDEANGHQFEYPESFEADAGACFAKRMTPEQAAKALMADYSA